MIRRLALSVLLSAACASAEAAPPRVATDIAPVQSLAAEVMEGLGAPGLIMAPGASPHHYALRPSEASALSRAELVIYVGADLAPWFDTARQALAPDAAALDLSSVPGVTLLQARNGGEEDGDHHHGPVDPHLWLDPDNARAWLSAIAAALSEADPENAATYAANAEAARARIAGLSEEIAGMLAPVRDRPFLVYHDAFQYFVRRYDLAELGAVTDSHATSPGAARMARMRGLAAQAVCIFVEPQFPTQIAETLVEGTGARIAVLDPAGAGLAPGAEFYPTLLRDLAENLVACLRGD